MGCLVLSGALVAPWLAWNRANLGTWTANGQAKAMQQGVVNPTNRDYHVDEVLRRLPEVLDGTTPQDWGSSWNEPLPKTVTWFLLVVVFGLPVLLYRRRRHGSSAELLVLAAPLLFSVSTVAWITVVQDWPSMFARYVREANPGWYLFAFLVWDRLTVERSATVRLVAGSTIAVAALWVFDYGRYLA